MKIAVVVPSISRAGGGVAEAAKSLAQLLASRPGLDVQVFTLRDAHYEDDIQAWSGINVRASKIFGPKRYGFSPSLASNILSYRPDIVHVHGLWMFHCLAILLWSLATRRPYIVTPHGMLESWIIRRSYIIKRIVSATYQDYFIKRASAIHVLTHKESTDVLALSDHTNIHVVPNFISTNPYDTTSPPTWWSTELSDKRIYLFLGRIHEKKGWRELIRAWEQLAIEDPDFSDRAALVFCGWIDDSDDFLAFLQQRGGNIIYAGPQFGADKLNSMRYAHAFVLPSKSEGLPLTVLEAWGVGTPVLMTAACNLPIGFDRAAAVEIGETPEAIAVGLRVAESWTPEERDRLIVAGRRLVSEVFSPSAVGEQMVRLFRRCLETSDGLQAGESS